MNNVELAPFEALAKEILRRCMAEDDPSDIRQWIGDMLLRLGADNNNDAILGWVESFDFQDRMIAEYEEQANLPEGERKVLRWPWDSWNRLIDPLEPGMLGLVTAPDGMGKTIYAESIAEFWAQHRNRVAFVHYELNRRLMMLRRTARHTSILVRTIKEGKLTAADKQSISSIRQKLLAWDGYINYVHTPGWSMEKTIAELSRLNAEGQLDVIVLDYLEKAAASRRQIQLFGSNAFQREADNVEQLKNFAESTGIPVLMIAQMNKEGKSTSFDKIDRTGIRGAGEKSDKANLVVLLNRARENDGYSNTVNVLVDKNTMGGTGTFEQVMQPEYYRVGDPYIDPMGHKSI